MSHLESHSDRLRCHWMTELYIHPSIFMETVAPSRLLKPRNSRHIIAGTHWLTNTQSRWHISGQFLLPEGKSHLEFQSCAATPISQCGVCRREVLRTTSWTLSPPGVHPGRIHAGLERPTLIERRFTLQMTSPQNHRRFIRSRTRLSVTVLDKIQIQQINRLFNTLFQSWPESRRDVARTNLNSPGCVYLQKSRFLSHSLMKCWGLTFAESVDKFLTRWRWRVDPIHDLFKLVSPQVWRPPSIGGDSKDQRDVERKTHGMHPYVLS